MVLKHYKVCDDISDVIARKIHQNKQVDINIDIKKKNALWVLVHNEMYERIEKSNVSTHIYTLDGKLFTVRHDEDLSLKFYDEDIDSDKMHDFTSKFINSLDIAYMDITSGVWEGGSDESYKDNRLWGSIHNIPCIN